MGTEKEFCKMMISMWPAFVLLMHYDQISQLLSEKYEAAFLQNIIQILGLTIFTIQTTPF